MFYHKCTVKFSALLLCMIVSFWMGWNSAKTAMWDGRTSRALLSQTTSKLRASCPPQPKAVVQRPARPRSRPRPRIILASTNSAFLNFTMNWLEGLKRCGVGETVVIMAENQEAYDILRGVRPGFKLDVKYAGEANATGSRLKYLSPLYLQLVNKRPRYILSYLKKGIDVLFSDVDVVWLKNPMPYFNDGYDMYLQMDRVYNRSDQADIACAGFTYYSATPATISLVETWLDKIQASPTASDQWLLHTILRTHPVGLNVTRLDYKRFISGFYFFNQNWRRNNTDIDPVIVHANFEKSQRRKVDKLKKEKMWYI